MERPPMSLGLQGKMVLQGGWKQYMPWVTEGIKGLRGGTVLGR